MPSRDTTRRLRHVGLRIKRLRESKGMSRQSLAKQFKVDVTSIAGWESGKRLPRHPRRLQLAQALGVDVSTLFSVGPDNDDTIPVCATLVDTFKELPCLLTDLLAKTRIRLRAARLAAPYTTSAFVQTEFRAGLSKRIIENTIEVQRIEIFYDLRRLQETLSNIFRFEGHSYYVKSYCAGVTDVVPAIGGYFFDDDEFILGAYWSGVPPHHRLSLRMSGNPFERFFNDYWDEIWRRGTLINITGSRDLSAVRALALKLGLGKDEWPDFVKNAQTLDIGDGAPPLV